MPPSKSRQSFSRKGNIVGHAEVPWCIVRFYLSTGSFVQLVSSGANDPVSKNADTLANKCHRAALTVIMIYYSFNLLEQTMLIARIYVGARRTSIYQSRKLVATSRIHQRTFDVLLWTRGWSIQMGDWHRHIRSSTPRGEDQKRRRRRGIKVPTNSKSSRLPS